MLSRVADSLYWMSRYLERAEHAARVTAVQLNLMLDQGPGSAGRRWARVLRSLGGPPLEPGDDAYRAALGHAFGLIVSCIVSARENARQVREQISSEMWEQFNQLFHELNRAGIEETWETAPLDFLQAVVRGSYMFQGVTDATMNHGEAWQFIQIGRHLERIPSIASVLDAHFRDLAPETGEALESEGRLEWIGLLRCATAFEAYCKVYTASVRAEKVLEFLLFNSEFPHSMRFAAEHLERSLDALHTVSPTRRANLVNRLAGRMRADLSFTPADEILLSLHPFFDGIRNQAAQIHSAIYRQYVSYPIEAALES